ncbi:membrane transporter [Crucibulum laeve]|uniref:Membrane transporter n=1 Tax=Crucibulum laeve TaxID=68775 RepID=A0A5C3LFG1_9AGAR|nr:membrane transporter [Crucibulum laeve]
MTSISPPSTSSGSQPSITAGNEEKEDLERRLSTVDVVSVNELVGSLPDPELKLPRRRSLVIIILGSTLFQFSFFVIISSASAYTEHLGGTATFSGLTIGIPTVLSGIALIFVAKYDGGGYSRPFNIAYASMLVGNVLYALAYRAHWLYLILIGRMVVGIGFTSFMFIKKYCSDPDIVGIRRRTTLASWIVLSQGFGFSAGPFLGGLLYKVGFSNEIFNGYTSPGWIMAIIWAIFWAASVLLFEDVPRTPSETASPPTEKIQDNKGTPQSSVTPSPISWDRGARGLTMRQWAVVFFMCYYSMTCFFILSAWEANIPVFSGIALGYSPYGAGNFIALGGITTFPLLLLNVWYARRIQDRVTLAVGTSLGLGGILILLAILCADKVSFGPFYVAWFLVALGFNLASTCTMSLLSKQLPDSWNKDVSMAIQYSNYLGRVTGAIMGGAGVSMGMKNYAATQIAVVGLGGVMQMLLWKDLKAKKG